MHSRLRKEAIADESDGDDREDMDGLGRTGNGKLDRRVK